MTDSESSQTDLDRADVTDAEAEKRGRMRHDWDNLIEDLIEDGRQRGLFDNLSGKGQPLNLLKNPYEGSQAISNQLLKDNNLRPAWITHRLGVEERVDRLRRDIAREWRRYQSAFDQSVGTAHRTALSNGWDEQCLRWETEIVAINKLIDSYNLRRPSSTMEIFKLRLADELTAAKAQRRLIV